jgi:hypothetical protein
MNLILCFSKQLHFFSTANQQADDGIKCNIPRQIGHVSESLHAQSCKCQPRTRRTNLVGSQAICLPSASSSEPYGANEL